MSILITGGTGTLGKELIRQLQFIDAEQRICVFSRDEFKQAELKKIYPEGGAKGLRYFIGDVRDYERLKTAFKGVDTVIHAAAMKRIEVCEYDPQEALLTNTIGSYNVIRAAIENNVSKCIFISTDKAPAASTMYGATKLCAERLFIGSNNLGKTKFSVVRYGNVMGSRGSVKELWEKQVIAGEPITVTDKRMTRFFWTIQEAASFVLHKIDIMQGGEIFLPVMKSYSIYEMAKEISENIIETGIRGIEKLHETLLTEEEVNFCYYMQEQTAPIEYYTIYPFQHDWCKEIKIKGVKVHKNFTLASGFKEYDDMKINVKRIDLPENVDCIVNKTSTTFKKGDKKASLKHRVLEVSDIVNGLNVELFEKEVIENCHLGRSVGIIRIQDEENLEDVLKTYFRN